VKQTHTLECRDLDAILEGAIRTNAQIILQSPNWGEITLNGYLISGDERALLMEITGSPALRMENQHGVPCEGHLYADQRYVFQTRISATPQWGRSRSVALDRPTTLRVMDRRRFSRAKLAPSSTVRLEWTHDGLARRCTAPLLNISADGMACRVDPGIAGAMPRGDLLVTRFKLPHHPQTFVLEAAVLNVTGTPDDRVLIGLQFVRSQKYAEMLTMLRHALTGPIPHYSPAEQFA
jgi:hypothetical protein